MADTETRDVAAHHRWVSEPADWLRGLAICAVAGAFLAVTGAFNSGGATVGQRLLYWIPLMMIGGIVGNLIARPMFDLRALAARPWLACALVTLMMTPPLTVIVWAHNNLMFRQDWDPAEILSGLLPVAMISAAMTTINYLADRRPRETLAAAPGAGPARFLERIPHKLRGGALLAVQAEDHYLRIHTESGSDLILMRLSDAISELEGIEGAQTHRSWWVARTAVASVERGDGRATLILRDGARVPVSRTYARTLRAEGWY